MNKTFSFECICGGYHYLEVDIWDENTGEKIIAFIDQPKSFWWFLKSWWYHRRIYVNDLILTKEQCEELKKILNGK